MDMATAKLFKFILPADTVPLTFKLPPTPTPPAIVNAPVFVLVDDAVFVILTATVVDGIDVAVTAVVINVPVFNVQV
jgi:hypothetical protein